MSDQGWITPERFVAKQAKRMVPPRGRLLISSCHSGSYLAKQVVERYRCLLREEGNQSEVLYLEEVDRQFSDGETCARLGLHVGGYDVFCSRPCTIQPRSAVSIRTTWPSSSPRGLFGNTAPATSRPCCPTWPMGGRTSRHDLCVNRRLPSSWQI